MGSCFDHMRKVDRDAGKSKREEIKDEEKPHVQLERDCSVWMIVRRIGREHRMTTAMVIARVL